MNGDLISWETDEIRKAAKIKTHFARIVVGGPVMNPCYSILWYDPSDRDYHIGYSSYSLMNVYDWLRDEFEITNSHFDNEPVVHGRWDGLTYDGYADGCPVYDLWECSICGFEHAGEDDTLPNFCPYCGAKMDMEEKRDD